MELWRPRGSYQVSNLGRIKGKSGKILKPYTQRCGYLHVTIWEDGERKTMKVHRLVALAWIPIEDNKPYVDHINRIKTDNRVENLRWVTSSENCLNKKGGKLGHSYISEQTYKQGYVYYRLGIHILKIVKLYKKTKYTLEEVIAERDKILEENGIKLHQQTFDATPAPDISSTLVDAQ